MCGISGIIKFKQQAVDTKRLQMMMMRMKHRGPDDEGTFVHNHVGLGFVRLSILDLTAAGHQPMTDETGRYTIIQNGESYNYIELREELNALGYTFRTGTDTEVILAGYKAWGDAILDRLNGMFAMAIYDKQEQKLFLARDRFGVKPLYYYYADDELIFASEIPSILAVLPNKSEADDEAIFDYLVFNRTDQTDRTFFKNIRKLQHGCCVTIDCATPSPSLNIRKWYNLADHVAQMPKEKDEKTHFMELFTNAIRLRLRSDVPWGVCLSGGLDSSSITAAIINVLNEKNVHSFSAVYGKDSKADESRYIDEFTGIVPNMHYTYPEAEGLYADLQRYVQCQAEPTPTTSPYAQYCVMKEAKQYVKVTLDGQGADESLAGYEYIPGLYYKTLFTHFRWITLLKEIVCYLKVHHSTRSLKYFAFFMLPAKYRTKVRVSQRGYINPDFVQKYKNSVIADKLYGSQSMREMLINHFEYKLEHLLKWGDRNSMAHSMESRAPFLDKDLVEYALSLVDDQKIHNGYTKYILRDVMKGIMPEKVRMRVDKMGFSVPQDEWFRTPKFRELIMSILSSDTFAKRGYIVPAEAIKLYQRHLSGEINISKDIWKWINLELWFREFID